MNTSEPTVPILTAAQRDGLMELFNIALGRAAASFSELTDRRVEFYLPKVAIHHLNHLTEALGFLIEGEVVTVHQTFSGPITGHALFLTSYSDAGKLVHLLTGAQSPSPQLSALDIGAMTEIGNIVLNACLGMFGNLLKVHMHFVVPRLYSETLQGLLDSLKIDQAGLRFALVADMPFTIRDAEVHNHIIFVMGITSVNRLLQAIEEM